MGRSLREAKGELQLNAMLLAPHQVEVLFVLCTLLSNRRKPDVQALLAELGMVEALATMFWRLDWGSPTPNTPHPAEGIHGPGCECNPDSALRVQYLRLVHNFCDRDCRNNGPKARMLSASERELLANGEFSTQGPNILYQQLRGGRVDDAPREISSGWPPVDSGSAGVEAGAAGAGGGAAAEGGGRGEAQRNGGIGVGGTRRGLLTSIVRVVMEEPSDSIYRFWLASCAEAFLRGATRQEQLFIAHTGLLQFLMDEITSSGLRTAGSLQTVFDLLGELCKGNPALLGVLDCGMTERQVRRLTRVVVKDLVDSNVFVRSLFLSMDHFGASEGMYRRDPGGGGGGDGEGEREAGRARHQLDWHAATAGDGIGAGGWSSSGSSSSSSSGSEDAEMEGLSSSGGVDGSGEERGGVWWPSGNLGKSKGAGGGKRKRVRKREGQTQTQTSYISKAAVKACDASYLEHSWIDVQPTLLRDAAADAAVGDTAPVAPPATGAGAAGAAAAAAAATAAAAAGAPASAERKRKGSKAVGQGQKKGKGEGAGLDSGSGSGEVSLSVLSSSALVAAAAAEGLYGGEQLVIQQPREGELVDDSMAMEALSEATRTVQAHLAGTRMREGQGGEGGEEGGEGDQAGRGRRTSDCSSTETGSSGEYASGLSHASGVRSRVSSVSGNSSDHGYESAVSVQEGGQMAVLASREGRDSDDEDAETVVEEDVEVEGEGGDGADMDVDMGTAAGALSSTNEPAVSPTAAAAAVDAQVAEAAPVVPTAQEEGHVTATTTTTARGRGAGTDPPGHGGGGGGEGGVVCRVQRFLLENLPRLLRDLMGVVDVQNVNHENICCLNTIITMLVQVDRMGRMPEVLEAVRRLGPRDKASFFRSSSASTTTTTTKPTTGRGSGAVEAVSAASSSSTVVSTSTAESLPACTNGGGGELGEASASGDGAGPRLATGSSWVNLLGSVGGGASSATPSPPQQQRHGEGGGGPGVGYGIGYADLLSDGDEDEGAQGEAEGEEATASAAAAAVAAGGGAGGRGRTSGASCGGGGGGGEDGARGEGNDDDEDDHTKSSWSGERILSSFRQLLWFWQEYYSRRGRDRLSLEFSSHMTFAEWSRTVTALCKDDGSPGALLAHPPRWVMSSPYDRPPRVKGSILGQPW